MLQMVTFITHNKCCESILYLQIKLIIPNEYLILGLLKDIPIGEAERLLSAAPISDADLHLVIKKKFQFSSSIKFKLI